MSELNDPYKLSDFIRESLYRKMDTVPEEELFGQFIKKNAYLTELPTVKDSLTTAEKSSDVQEYDQQVAAYQKLLDEMMELHLRKIKDYGPHAINATGEVGIVVRMWDKMARLLNLTGWDITTGKQTSAKSPNNESVDDTLMDLASYALIMLVYRQGKWGK